MPVKVFALLLLLPAIVAAQQPATPLTLAQAVERARTHSPLRASAVEFANGAASAAKLAGRLSNPLLDVRVENLAPQSALAPDRDVFAVISQPIELGGKRGVRRDIATADSEISTLLLRSVDRQIALDTVRAYMRAVRARDALATLSLQRERVGMLVTTMERRVGEGFSPESDLQRFEAEAARMGAEMMRTQIDLNRALLDLTSLTGAAIAAEQLVAPQPIAAPTLAADAIDEAVDRRPDVLVAAARADRARFFATLEHAKRLPDPTLSGGYKRTQGQNTAIAALVVAVPLFDRNNQARALAESNVRAAGLERDAVHARAVAEARASLAAATALSDSLTRVERELLAPAEGVRNAALAMFREGAADVLKLVDAERIYTDVRRDALSLAVDAYVAAIEARFALAQEDVP
jgi:cobalt-zinc-cadmium efflux system outer membrane protein